jgi:hypothetical protein
MGFYLIVDDQEAFPVWKEDKSVEWPVGQLLAVCKFFHWWW